MLPAWGRVLCWRFCCLRDDRKPDNIEDVGGGYGKGYKAAVSEWRKLREEISKVRAIGMNIIILAHCQVKNFKNPAGPDYDRYVMKVEKNAGAVFAEWADCHLFAQFEGGVNKERSGKAKGWSSDARVMHTRRTAAWDAKNRFDLPETMPLSWDEFEAATRAGRLPAAVRKRIEALLEKLSEDDEAKVRAGLIRAGEDALKLGQLENWALAKLPEEGE